MEKSPRVMPPALPTPLHPHRRRSHEKRVAASSMVGDGRARALKRAIRTKFRRAQLPDPAFIFKRFFDILPSSGACII